MNTDWKPIETCPKCADYLLFESGTHLNDPGWIFIGYYDPDIGSGEWVDCNGDCVSPTYWMELPRYPEIR